MKKLLTSFIAIAITVVALPMFAAFEAHVVNVTATIDNALTVPLDSLDFGEVFPQEVLDKTFDINLSNSCLNQGGGNTVFGSELLTNGDFETPVVVNAAGWDIFPSGTPGLGWNVLWSPLDAASFNSVNRPAIANLELHGAVAGWAHAHGNQHSELDSDWFGPSSSQTGEPALVNIYQDIPTTIGQKYLLTYAFAARPATDAAQNVLDVFVGGAHAANNVLSSTTTQPQWFGYSYEFTATTTTTRIEFDGGGTPDSLGVFLDNVSLKSETTTGGCSVNYMIRQKPKCADIRNPDVHPQVTENQDGTFICPEGSTMMPLLCPFLSKHEVTSDGTSAENDSSGINSFHGLPGTWNEAVTEATQVLGFLNGNVGDSKDTWDIDLHAPCFKGECAQDWAAYVHAQNPGANPADYENNPANKGIKMGCDLWVEVTGINGQTNCTPTDGATVDIVSDTSNTVEEYAGANAKALSFIHPAWTANIPGATWIWSDNPVVDPTIDDTKTFDKSFTVVGTPTSATLDVAADNFYTFYVNGVQVSSEQVNGNTFANVQHVDISANVHTGLNTIKAVVTNLHVGGSNAAGNPAGLLYKVEYKTAPIQCAI